MVHHTAPASEHGELADVQFRKVTAIIRSSVLERVEQRLQGLCVPGISVRKVKGYGEYANLFSRDWMVEHARLEIFVRRERADEIARAILDAAQTGLAGDGIVVVLPVEAVYRVRTGELATSDELAAAQRDEAANPRQDGSHGPSPGAP